MLKTGLNWFDRLSWCKTCSHQEECLVRKFCFFQKDVLISFWIDCIIKKTSQPIWFSLFWSHALSRCCYIKLIFCKRHLLSLSEVAFFYSVILPFFALVWTDKSHAKTGLNFCAVHSCWCEKAINTVLKWSSASLAGLPLSLPDE